MIENNPDYFHNIGVVLLARAAQAYGVPLTDLFSPTAPTPPNSRMEEDVNLSLIEQVACAEGWLASDLLEITKEYRRESLAAAARGRVARLSKEEIHNRHSTLEKKRLDESRLI